MIATASDCLTDQQIGDLAAGRLPAERFTRLLDHLESCPQCQWRAEQADPSSDSIVRALGKTARPDPHAAEPDCLALLRLRDTSDRIEAAVTTPPIEQLAKYQLIRPLGSGGMGAVYLANHDRLRRRCAVKLLPLQRSRDAGWRERFDREMAAVAALDDPHVVAATDAGEVDGWSYLVMEYLDGLDLSRLAMRLGMLEVADACELIRQAAIGLIHIHAAGLVHRDIKPSNLMLTRDGVVKILDLGLVLSGTDPLPADDRLTTVGQLIGTVAYMAPEQLADCSAVDRRADLYALGATLYRLLAGTPPHGPARGIAPLIVAKTGRDAPPLAEYRRDVPATVNDLVRRLLERDPAARPESAEEVARTLTPPAADARLQRLVATALRKGPSVEESSAPLPTPARPAPPPEPPRRRRRRSLIAAASLPLLLLAGVVITLVTDQGQLVIQSEADDVVISVQRDDREVRRMELETGDNRIRLRSGEYTVSVEGQADRIRLSDDAATVTRGGQTVLSVRRVAAPEVPPRVVDAAPDPAATPGGAEPMFGGEPLSRWLTILESDRDIEKIIEAMRAVAEIGGFELTDDPTAVVQESQRRRAAAAMLRLARRYGGLVTGWGTNHPSHRFMDALLKYYPALLPDPGLERLVDELQHGSEKSSIAATWLLREYLSPPEHRSGQLYQPDPDGLHRWAETTDGRRRLEQLAERLDRFAATRGGYVVEVESTARTDADTGPFLTVSTQVEVNMAYPVRLSINQALGRNSLADPAIGPRLRVLTEAAEVFCRQALEAAPAEAGKQRRTAGIAVVLTDQEIEAVLEHAPADSRAWFLAPSIYQRHHLTPERRLELQRQLAENDPAGTADAVLAVLRHIVDHPSRLRGGSGYGGGYGGLGPGGRSDMDYGGEMGYESDMGGGMPGRSYMPDAGLMYGLESMYGRGDYMGEYGMDDHGGMDKYGGGDMYGDEMYGGAGGLGMGAPMGPGRMIQVDALLEHAIELIAASTTRPRLALEVLSRFVEDKTQAAREQLQSRLTAQLEDKH